MIHEILADDLNLSIFEVNGEVKADDYRNIILPVLAAQQKKYDQIKMVYILNTDISNYSVGALFEDGITALKFIKNWKKVALVSDHEKVNSSLEFVFKLLPGKYKSFPLSQKDEAIEWAKSDI